MNIMHGDGSSRQRFCKKKEPQCRWLTIASSVAFILFALAKPVSAAENEEHYGSMVTSVLGNIDTLDGAKAYNWDNFTLAQYIYAALLRWNPYDDAIEGDIASAWSITPDGKLWRFTLSDEVKFHDGSPVEVDDVLYSFNRIALPQTESPFGAFLSNVVGYKAVQNGEAKTLSGVRRTGERSLEIELLRADAGFEKVLSNSLTAILPDNSDGSIDFDRMPVGAGSYRVVENTNEHVLLERSPSYKHANPFPALHIKVLKNVSAYAAVRGIENGEMHYSLLYHMPRDIALLFEHPLYSRLFVQQPANSTIYLALNTQRPALQDARVRRGLNLAIDREVLVERHLKVSASPTNSILPVSMRHLSKENGGHVFGRYVNNADTALARELLREAGFDHSKPLSMIALATGANENVAFELVNMLSNVNVQVVLDALPSEEFHRRAEAGLDDLIFSDGAAWFADFDDPSNYYFPLFSQGGLAHYNWSKLDSASLDLEAHRINAMIHEPEERNDAWIDLFDRLQSQYTPWIPLYHRNLYMLIDDPNSLTPRDSRSFYYKVQIMAKKQQQQNAQSYSD